MIYLYSDSFDSQIKTPQDFTKHLNRWLADIDPFYYDGDYSRDVFITFLIDEQASEEHCKVFRVGFLPFKIEGLPCFNYNTMIEQFVLIDRLDVAFKFYKEYESYFFNSLIP